MPGTSLQDYQAYVHLDRQVQQLELANQKRSGFAENADRGRFTISPTCPPSTSLRFQGGLLWWPANDFWSNGYFMPTYVVDLADRDKTRVVFQFTNPYWYRPLIVQVGNYLHPFPEPWPDTVPDDYLRFGGTGEYETAAEAEERARELVAQSYVGYGFISGTVVFRNNGNTEDYQQFLPIDPVNRGRSYIFDSRKRYGWELA